MKRSRLNLFKATSMTISVLGVVLIIVTVGIIFYIGFQSLSSFISYDASSGSSYDKLSALKSEYTTLKGQFDNIKIEVDKNNNKNFKIAYVNAELELIKAQSAITDVESAMSANESPQEIQNRINAAQVQMQKAKTSLSDLRSMM
ncbi:MAG: hypothetical protein BME94_05320 [Methanobacteriales archaeon Met13]